MKLLSPGNTGKFVAKTLSEDFLAVCNFVTIIRGFLTRMQFCNYYPGIFLAVCNANDLFDSDFLD